MRLMGCLKFLVVAVLLLVVGFYAGYRNEWVQKRLFYPFLYQELVYTYAEKRNLDPYMVAAVIKAESKFNTKARSPKGASGLMQLMPDTATWIVSQINYKDFKVSDLEDPEINIKLGTWYLEELKHEFSNNEVLTLAAYNAGRGNVKQWMRQYGWTLNFNDPDQIPFRETRDYVKKIQKDKQQYRALYGR